MKTYGGPVLYVKDTKVTLPKILKWVSHCAVNSKAE